MARLCVTDVEKRAPTELMLKGAATYFGLGALIGAAVLFFVVGILAALGLLEIYSHAVTLAVLIPVASAATASFVEELLFRGVLCGACRRPSIC